MLLLLHRVHGVVLLIICAVEDNELDGALDNPFVLVFLFIVVFVLLVWLVVLAFSC